MPVVVSTASVPAFPRRSLDAIRFLDESPVTNSPLWPLPVTRLPATVPFRTSSRSIPSSRLPRTSFCRIDGLLVWCTTIPWLLFVTWLDVMVTCPACTTPIPVAESSTVYRLRLILFPAMNASAPVFTSIPFWAITAVGPAPVIVFPTITADEPL